MGLFDMPPGALGGGVVFPPKYNTAIRPIATASVI